MKKRSFTILSLFLILFLGVAAMSACGWNPEVTAVPITAPWGSLNLPIKENAIVWRSDDNEFRAVHRDDKRTVTKAYTDALKASGWQLAKFDQSGERYLVDMTKDGETLNLEFYDFSNTGVVITKK